MAYLNTNSLIDGVQGSIGNLVFKTMYGKTFVSSKPGKINRKKETAAQRGTRTTFKAATEWAKTTLQDPQQKEYYKQHAKALNLPNAYTAAITDYMRKPKVVKLVNKKEVILVVSKPGFELKHAEVKPKDVTIPVPQIHAEKTKHGWEFIITKPAVETNMLLTITTANVMGRMRSVEMMV